MFKRSFLRILTIFHHFWPQFWHPFWPLGYPKWVKFWSTLKVHGTLKFPIWNNIHVEIYSVQSSFLTRWALFDPFQPIFDPPFWPLGYPKWVKFWNMSKVNETIKFPVWNNIYVEIYSVQSSFLTWWTLLTHFWHVLTPFLPLGCPKWVKFCNTSKLHDTITFFL